MPVDAADFRVESPLEYQMRHNLFYEPPNPYASGKGHKSDNGREGPTGSDWTPTPIPPRNHATAAPLPPVAAPQPAPPHPIAFQVRNPDGTYMRIPAEAMAYAAPALAMARMAGGPLAVQPIYASPPPKPIVAPDAAIKAIQRISNAQPPKDAIEPYYGIETKLFGSIATLKALYDTGALIKNSIFANKNGSLGNKFPEDPSKIGHIFRNDEGHVIDTAENRRLIESVANDKNNYLGDDKFGCCWFAKNNSNGTQTWVRVRGNKITNAGINKLPEKYNEVTGLNNPEKPTPKR